MGDIPELVFAEHREAAKRLFEKGKITEALETYENECLPRAAFKDQQATVFSNMAMCSLKLGKYEQAFDSLQGALKAQRNCSELDPAVQIKIKFRLSTVLSQHLRDFTQANSILKHLKKYCNTYHKLDLFKEASALYEKQSELINNRDKGKFKIKDIVMKYHPERPLDILT